MQFTDRWIYYMDVLEYSCDEKNESNNKSIWSIRILISFVLLLFAAFRDCFQITPLFYSSIFFTWG